MNAVFLATLPVTAESEHAREHDAFVVKNTRWPVALLTDEVLVVLKEGLRLTIDRARYAKSIKIE